MQTRDIPEDQWVAYFDEFSRSHLGWHATIAVLDGELGMQYVAENLPLGGISFDHKGTRPTAVRISVGDTVDQHLNHAIDLPLHIRAAGDDDLGKLDLQFEPATGPTTLVHLENPPA